MTFTSSAALVGHLVAALAERRRALGIKQRELDEKAGFTDSLCEKYEAGIRTPSLQALTWWAEALGLKIGPILDNVVGPSREERKRAAIVLLSNGNKGRKVARMLDLPNSTVAYWRRTLVQSLDKKTVAAPEAGPKALPPTDKASRDHGRPE